MGSDLMPDNADLIEQCEDEIWQIISKLHKAGVRYTVVQFILTEMISTLELQGYCEDWLSQFLPKENEDA